MRHTVNNNGESRRKWMWVALMFCAAFATRGTGVEGKTTFTLDANKCEQLISIPPPDPLLEKEHCSVCEQIVLNSRMWNWQQNYEALCTNVPPHALTWVRRVFYRLFLLVTTT